MSASEARIPLNNGLCIPLLGLGTFVEGMSWTFSHKLSISVNIFRNYWRCHAVDLFTRKKIFFLWFWICNKMVPICNCPWWRTGLSWVIVEKEYFVDIAYDSSILSNRFIVFLGPHCLPRRDVSLMNATPYELSAISCSLRKKSHYLHFTFATASDQGPFDMSPVFRKRIVSPLYNTISCQSIQRLFGL